MKANELRVGNSIQLYRKPTDSEMTTHFIKSIYSVYFEPDHEEWFIQIEDGFCVNVKSGISPIPLAEEWLVKFGFKKSKKDFIHHPLHLHLLANEFTIFIKDGGGWFKTIKYIHQLQNLYFTLTDEELKIEL